MKNIQKLLSQSNWISINKCLVKAIGLEPTYLLSYLLDWYDYHEAREELVYGRFFYATCETIEERTCLTRSKQESIIPKLEKIGIIQTRLIGTPAKKHFAFTDNAEEIVFEILQNPQAVFGKAANKFAEKPQTCLQKSRKLVCGKNEDKFAEKPQQLISNKEELKEELREREQKKSHTPSQKKLSFPKNQKSQKEKNSAQKEKGIQDERIEPVTDSMTTDEPNPAAAEYMRLCAELEAEREAAANKPHESFSFNVNAPIRFTEACKSYIEIARSRNEGSGAAAWTTAKAQNFIKDMERFATLDLLNNSFFAQNPLEAFQCVAEAIEDANRADKQWVMRQSLIMDYCKRFIERKKAIESESKFADIEQTISRLGYTMSKQSLNSLFLKVKELFRGNPTDAQVKASMTRFLSNKECRKYSDLNAVLNNFSYLAKVVSEKK